MRTLIILTICIAGCASTFLSHPVSENHKDVLILSIIIQDHLRKTNGREFNLQDLKQADSLNRIANNFQKVEFISKGGHISVYYKFSESRETKEIFLSDKENDKIKSFKWKEKKLKCLCDGEIQLDYGERFYRIVKINNNKKIK